MRALITAILLTLTCNALAEETVESCNKVGAFAESIATYRDKGFTLAQQIGGSETGSITVVIALDVYKRLYLTPKQLSDSWVIKCFEGKL